MLVIYAESHAMEDALEHDKQHEAFNHNRISDSCCSISSYLKVTPSVTLGLFKKRIPIFFMKTEEPLYIKRGTIRENAGAVVVLIMGVGVSILLLIFVGTLGGQVYVQTAPQILTLNATDSQAYENVTSAIRSAFSALSTTGNYLPIVVLASIVFLILGMVMSLGGYGGGGYGGGGVL